MSQAKCSSTPCWISDAPYPTSHFYRGCLRGKGLLLRTKVVKQVFRHPHFARTYQAKRFPTPCWISDARSPTFHFSEDVLGESFIFENQRRKTTPPTTYLLRMSEAKRSSRPPWISDARSPTSHCYEDVAGESFIFRTIVVSIILHLRRGRSCPGPPRYRGKLGTERPVTKQTRLRHMCLFVPFPVGSRGQGP